MFVLDKMLYLKLFKQAIHVKSIRKQQCLFSSQNLLRETHVVIAGAGLVANSVAYHLSKHGLKDVVVVDQNEIASGTSGLEAGSIGLFKPLTMRNIISCSLDLYQQLHSMGYDIGLKKTGCLYLAKSDDRVIALKRRLAYNIPTGLVCEFLSPDQIRSYNPCVATDDLKGGVWVPDDAIANPKAVSVILSDIAKQGGVEYIENCAIQEVCTNDRKICGVKTERGYIKCNVFVNCAGMWARELGLKCNVQTRIPAYPANQFLVHIEPFDENLPCIKDYDNQMYIMNTPKGISIGWFEKEAKPAFGSSKIPRDWKNFLADDMNHLRPLWENAVSRLPILKHSTHTTISNTIDNFTPDGRWILGETPEVKNYFVGCGMNGNALQSGGGIGKYVAEWIIEGRPTIDLLPFNISRFLDLHNNRQYLYQRTKEIVGRQYSILYPHQCEYKYARKLRCSPLYSILEKRGAVFGIKMGYERALYFDTSKSDNMPSSMPHGSFFKPKFFDYILREYDACREGVGIIDMSSFSKIEIRSTGDEVLPYLQHLCSNDVDIPIGRIIHSGMHNEKGGYENDCILLRLKKNKFFMVSPSSQQTKIFDWMSRNLPSDKTVSLNDVTSMYTVINVVGPKSRNLISELSGTEVKLLPFTYTNLDIGYISDIMVMGFTHTGEPGYCLYVPSEYALHAYNRLMAIGKDFGTRDVGTMTQRFMRIERFIPFWAEELSSTVTPYEAGNAYKVKLDKGDFIGREALAVQKDRGVTKKLVMFHMIDHDPDCEVWPWGGEPIYRNGAFVGVVTSTGFGFTNYKLVCLGFIKKPGFPIETQVTDPHPDQIIKDSFILDKNAVYEIDIAGTRFKMHPYLHPPYIPAGSSDLKKHFESDQDLTRGAINVFGL